MELVEVDSGRLTDDDADYQEAGQPAQRYGNRREFIETPEALPQFDFQFFLYRFPIVDLTAISYKWAVDVAVPYDV
ncbi:MAG TPA: hypothetical protein PK200_10775 [Spirochaetota bacterium]|nr:hypothetical protein [Spirochaetota bacterium]